MGEDPAADATGYLHRGYAEALAEFGTPRRLRRSGGWILERTIPGTSLRDAMGCYPLFCCRNWTALVDDLRELEGDLVSVCLVADPFGGHREDDLRLAFHDVMRPYKEHYVVDLRRSPGDFVSSHNLRNTRKALQAVEVGVCRVPSSLADDWIRLYATLIGRHGLRGLHRFSASSFRRQLLVPGCVALAATHQGQVVGMLLWYRQGEVAYYHLGAYSDMGYRLGASFAWFDAALRHFAGAGVRWLNLGGGAGVTSSPEDGLARFKRGWSTGTRTSYLCGRVLDADRYQALTDRHQTGCFFPVYRRGEAS